MSQHISTSQPPVLGPAHRPSMVPMALRRAGLLPWQNYRLTTGLLAEYAFSEGTGRSVADNSGNGKTINLDLPTTPNDTWTARGIATAAGLIQTPSLTGARTMVALIKVPYNQTSANYIISGGSSSGNGYLGSEAPSTYTTHIGATRGVRPLLKQVGGTSGAFALNRGGWYLLIGDFGAAYTTALGFGGRQSNTTGRCTAFEIAYAAVFSGTLDAGNRDQLYLLARSLLKSRGAYLDWRDCPTKTDVVAIWGQSNADGDAPISSLSAPDQALDLTGVKINCGANSNPFNPLAPLVLGSNNQSFAPITEFGPEFGIASLKPGDLTISKYGASGSRIYNTGGLCWAVDFANNTSHNALALSKLWEAEAQLLNSGIGPNLRGILWVQGESDMGLDLYADAYAVNLRALIVRFREQLSYPTLKVVIARSRDQYTSVPSTARATVRAAQASVGADPNNAWFDTDDCALLADALHYNAAGMKTLGQRAHSYFF